MPTKKPFAASDVESFSGIYYLNGGKTPAGYPIFSTSKKLIEAIREEAIERKGFKPNKFGFFSAYCTYRDAIDGRNFFKITLVRELFENDHLIHGSDCHCFWSQSRKEYETEVNKAYRSIGVDLKKDSKSDILNKLAKHLSGLPADQQATLCLLNGMLSVPVSGFLLLRSGAITYKLLNQVFNSPSQPDAWDEYDRFPEYLMIEKFGKCFTP